MIRKTIVATCDETGCAASATMPADGWLDLGSRDLCPKHARPLRAAADAARAALSKPLPDAKRLMPARSTRRRLQALIALGWSTDTLRAALAMSAASFARLLAADEVLEAQAHRVAVLYQRISLLAPPRTTPAEERAYLDAIEYAKPRRWVTPMAWDDIDRDDEPPLADGLGDDVDETAVELAIQGERVRLRYSERQEVVRRLHARQMGDQQIAAVTGWAGDTVLRIRRRLGLPGIVKEEQAA